MKYTHSLASTIRFQHCDPAGIVFYPRFVEMVHAAVEDFFAENLGFSYERMAREFRIGVPAVNLQIDFKAPGILDERILTQLLVERVGGSSLQMRVVIATLEGQAKLEAQVTIACATKRDGKLGSCPWPEVIRVQLDDRLQAAEATGEVALQQ